MTDNPDDVRVNLTETTRLTCRRAALIAYPLAEKTLGLALAIDTNEFGRLAVGLSIGQVADLEKQFARATRATPHELAALMQMITNNEEGQ